MILKKAGLEQFSTHNLEHTFATNLLEKRNDTYARLKEILGHKSIETTQIYTHVDRNNLLKKAQGINSVHE